MNRTVPELRMSSSVPIDCQEISSLGRSSVISASHSTVLPAGALATQCERCDPVVSTIPRWYMNRGRFSKSRQNA